MRTNLHNRLLERVREKKTSSKQGGRPTSGVFRMDSTTRGNMYSAVVTVSLQNAAQITAAAGTYNLPETKFAGVLIENYLREHAPYLESIAPECDVRGRKFGGTGNSKTNLWLVVAMSEGLALAARQIRNRTPELSAMTDYQLLSKVLELATVDLMESSEVPELAEKRRDSAHDETQTDEKMLLQSFSDELNASTMADADDVPEPPRAAIALSPHITEPPPASPKKQGFKLPGFVKKAAETRQHEIETAEE